MKTLALFLAAALLSAPLAFSDETPAAAPASPKALSRFSLGTYLAFWDAKDVDNFDLDGFIGGGIVGQIRLLDALALEMRLSGFGTGESSDVFVPGEGWFENNSTLVAMPLEIGLVASLKLGDKFSLYGGPGASYTVFDAEFTSEQGRWKETYDLEMDDEFGAYLLLGARFQLARNASIFAEAKYNWIETSFESDVVALAADDARFDVLPLRNDLDFSGLALQAGILFTF